jgi:peptidoglycan/LPS O-acetylase OafA/YrhL
MFRFWKLCSIKHAEARVEEMDSSMHGRWDSVFLSSHCLRRACRIYPELYFTMCFTVIFGLAGTRRS